MKSFKVHLTEAASNAEINKVLQKYVNGDVPDDYENQQADPEELFKQLHDIMAKAGYKYVIMKDGKPFEGSGIVIKDNQPYHFELSDDGDNKPDKKLHVELKKNDNGNYFFSYVRVE